MFVLDSSIRILAILYKAMLAAQEGRPEENSFGTDLAELAVALARQIGRAGDGRDV